MGRKRKDVSQRAQRLRSKQEMTHKGKLPRLLRKIRVAIDSLAKQAVRPGGLKRATRASSRQRERQKWGEGRKMGRTILLSSEGADRSMATCRRVSP